MSTIRGYRKWRRLLANGLHTLLLPATCCLCGLPGMRPRFDLCGICRELVPGSIPTAFESAVTFSRVIVPFEYAYPVDHFIRSLKFRGERRYARVMGMLLANAVAAEDIPHPQALVPVPLHSTRYRRRGFNQAYEIARFAAEELRIRVCPEILKRHLPTQEQSGLSLAQRRLNVRGAFSANRIRGISTVALVDDVLTTGNTAAEAAAALLGAGVQHVELWAVARVS